MRSKLTQALHKNTTGEYTGHNNTLYWTIAGHITIPLKQHKAGVWLYWNHNGFQYVEDQVLYWS